MGNRSRVAGIIGVLFSLLVNALVRLNRDDIIINSGYSRWRTYSTIATILMVVSIVAIIVIFVISLLRFAQQKKAAANEALRQRESERAAQSKQKLEDPEDVQKYFRELWREYQDSPRPGGKEMSKRAREIADQLQGMNNYQQRLEVLLTINDIGAMQSAREILQQLEDAICRASKLAINQYIATEDPVAFVEAAKLVIESNQKKLDGVEKYLTTLADYASKQDGDMDDAEASLELYCQQMRSMISEG